MEPDPSRQIAPRPAGYMRPPLWQRLAWMVGIWIASVTVLGAVALVLRLWLNG